MKIYLATWLEKNQAESLTRKKNKNRLLSYYFLKEDEKFDLEEYCEAGLMRDKK